MTTTEIEDLRYEVLDNNSQGIYLTQCHDFDAAEKLLVDTYNKLVQNQRLHGKKQQQQPQQEQQEGQSPQQPHSELAGIDPHNDELMVTSSANGSKPGTADPSVEHVRNNNNNQNNDTTNSTMLGGVDITGEGTYDPQLNDQLKATTLTNIAFVVYHKGLFRQALAHLEAAQDLERRWGVQSPAVSINLCVVFNAIGSFAAASQHALVAIDLLRRSSDNPSDEKKKLWGAAWHNLGIAQLQLVDPNDAEENSNVLLMFENSMAATIELLGRNHPMTRAVIETFRIVRKELKDRGAFRPHDRTRIRPELPKLHTFYSEEALAPLVVNQDGQQLPGQYTSYVATRVNRNGTIKKVPLSQRGCARAEERQLSVMLRTTDKVKYCEKIDSEPFAVGMLREEQGDLLAITDGSGNGGPTGKESYSAAAQQQLLKATTGLVPVPPPNSARIQRRALQLSSRRLARGEHGAPEKSPFYHSVGMYETVRSGGSSVGSGRIGDGGSPSRGGYLIKKGLHGIPLKGNLALAGALYANPHPVTQQVRLSRHYAYMNGREGSSHPNSARGVGGGYSPKSHRIPGGDGGTLRLPQIAIGTGQQRAMMAIMQGVDNGYITMSSGSGSRSTNGAPNSARARFTFSQQQQQQQLQQQQQQQQDAIYIQNVSGQSNYSTTTRQSAQQAMPMYPATGTGGNINTITTITTTTITDGAGSSSAPPSPQRSSSTQLTTQHRHQVAELLMGDMWVEAPVAAPRKLSPPGSGGSGSVALSHRAGYTQQLYTIDPKDRVVAPAQYAHPDASTSPHVNHSNTMSRGRSNSAIAATMPSAATNNTATGSPSPIREQQMNVSAAAAAFAGESNSALGTLVGQQPHPPSTSPNKAHRRSSGRVVIQADEDQTSSEAVNS